MPKLKKPRARSGSGKFIATTPPTAQIRTVTLTIRGPDGSSAGRYKGDTTLGDVLKAARMSGDAYRGNAQLDPGKTLDELGLADNQEVVLR